MDYTTFELMTKVNYCAFFLCSKYASRAMKIAHRFLPDAYFDIIQINSKSGLTGSNKNFAYAGGKFGGIGLVQSFALELVPFNYQGERDLPRAISRRVRCGPTRKRGFSCSI